MLEYSPVLNNIRDVTFGMNDGLVEVLTATVGLGAALQTPALVALGGFMVVISGTLSMAGGAYLSTEYERGLKKMQNRRYRSPKLSSFYVGVSYIIGALFPLAPFMLGYGGFYAIALSVALTACVLSAVAAMIAVVTGTGIKRRLAVTLVISMGAAALTIALGYFARVALKISV